MGCFSFICKECGEAVLSNSFSGQKVKLFLLKEGKVIQEMEGEYDSYGRVFTEDKKDSIYWDQEWLKVCDLIFSPSKGDGIAAVHSRCFTGKVPTTQSEDDPNQGWGMDGEYFINTDTTTVIE